MGVKNNPILRYFKLLIFYAKLDLLWLMRDTKIAILAILSDTLSTTASVSSIFLLSVRFKGIGNLTQYEVLFMLGYVTCLFGIFGMFFSMNNVGHISRRIGRGQLDHMVIQPLTFSWQLLTEGFIPFTGSSATIVGLLVVKVSLLKLNITVTWLWIFCFVFSLIVGTIIILSLSYIFSSTAFYAPVACEEISTLIINNLGSLSKYPLSGMPDYIKLPLITILPYGLMGWLPSMALLGKSPLHMPYLYSFIIALTLFSISIYVFTKGFNHYVKTGANRYKDMGHRR